jgi:hypothetical protein
MPNEEAIRFLTQKITGLQVVQQEMTRIYTSIKDLDEADDVRSQLTSLNEILFALQSARNSLQAATNVVPPPDANRVKALTDALRQLDGFVRSDQNIHLALNFLTQIADLIKQA